MMVRSLLAGAPICPKAGAAQMSASARPQAAPAVRETAELESALTEADLALFFEAEPGREPGQVPAPFLLAEGPDPLAFRPGKPQP